ncbi:MAG: hypothetical protein R2857_15485 [Vampirovibrionales bacterium]
MTVVGVAHFDGVVIDGRPVPPLLAVPISTVSSPRPLRTRVLSAWSTVTVLSAYGSARMTTSSASPMECLAVAASGSQAGIVTVNIDVVVAAAGSSRDAPLLTLLTVTVLPPRPARELQQVVGILDGNDVAAAIGPDAPLLVSPTATAAGRHGRTLLMRTLSASFTPMTSLLAPPVMRAGR